MRYFIVDAFTSEPFKGNPAAVVLLEREIPDRHMQAIAMEFNLAETAFLLQKKNNDWSLRWFTPTIEMDLCGHATLASTYAIWNLLKQPRQTLRFATLSGTLTAIPTEHQIELNFPAIGIEPLTDSQTLPAVLNLEPMFIGRTIHDLLIEVDEAETVKNYQPDFNVIANLPGRGLILTAKHKTFQNRASQNGDPDFVSRFFAPKIGIPEDPVTGAAHCALGPYWSHKLDKSKLLARQLSPRGGQLQVRLHNDRVLLTGDAVCTMQGEIIV